MIEKYSREWWDENTIPEPNTGCHIWLGTMDKLGYGHLRWKGKASGLAHRARYECAYGLFDQSLKVCHTCDHPWCVNPDHLFLGTQKDNLRDMYRKGRGRPFGLPVDGDMSDWHQQAPLKTATVA